MKTCPRSNLTTSGASASYPLGNPTNYLPFWQHSRDIGNVARYTLTGISKDDFLFGVVALDKDGNESVASYPKPYRPTRP